MDNRQELEELTLHCQKAAVQLRELINIPILHQIEIAAKQIDERQNPKNVRNNLLEPISQDNFEKTKRISKAAVEGFSLDKEDLLSVLEAEVLADSEQELKSLESKLKQLAPKSIDEIINEFQAAYTSSNKGLHQVEPLVVPPHIQVLAELIEIREPLRCYEEAVQISEKALSCLETRVTPVET